MTTPKTESVKIHAFTVENVKRVKLVQMVVDDKALTVIGGTNKQGKSSLLDAIMWTLGGDKFKPSKPLRDGAVALATKIELTNGIIVERTGKNNTLKVSTKEGLTGGQRLLDDFIEALALNLSAFLDSNDKEKAATVLKIIGVDLSKLDTLETQWTQERTILGRDAKQKRAYADSLPFNENAPKVETTIASITAEMQEAVEQNNKNTIQKTALVETKARLTNAGICINNQHLKVADLKAQLATAEAELKKFDAGANALRKQAADLDGVIANLHDIDTTKFQQQITEAESINAKVRTNAMQRQAQQTAKDAEAKHLKVEQDINNLRSERMALLAKAKMPLEGLTVEAGALVYNGQQWDNMSHAEQLQVATAIVRKVNPKCGFVLLDKIEAMDLDTLRKFGAWLEAEGMQAITTRVSTGPECDVLIIEGEVGTVKDTKKVSEE